MIKKNIAYLLISFIFTLTLNGQTDRSQQPKPGPAPTVEIGEFDSFTMDNGMNVIVVENRSIPVVSFRLRLDIDPVLEKEAKGYVNFAGQLMREGTKNRTKQEIDESIDFIGASLSTYSTGAFASSLTHHKETLLDIMSDVLMNPVFPEEELQRRITRTRTSLQATKTDNKAIANNIAKRMAYGPEHPYGEIMTEKTLENITVDKLKNYHSTYFKPNVAYMIIVGDIDKEESKELMNKYFREWEKGEVPSHSYPTPTPPEDRKVAFGERKNASQSVIKVTYPINLTPGDDDAIKADVMNNVLGGGVFSGRLMQNLREDKGYTYGARSRLNKDPVIGNFSAQTEVRNEVTDSAIVEILYEMDQMLKDTVEEKNLNLIQNYMSGRFTRSLENPRTIANFAYNIKRYNLTEDYYEKYLKNISKVTPENVYQMSQKYLKPENSIIVVVGNKDEVIEKLPQFSPTEEVKQFDAFGQPLTKADLKEIPDGININDVINKYYEARGGKEHFRNIERLKTIAKTSMMGMDFTLTSYKKAPDKMLVKTERNNEVFNIQLFDGKKAIISSHTGKETFTEGEKYESMKMQAILNREMTYKDHGIEKFLLGIDNIDGKDAYKVEVISPQGNKIYEYYGLESGLKVRTESTLGTTDISKYKDVRVGDKPSFFAKLFGKEKVMLKFPSHTIQKMQGQTLDVKTIEVIANPDIEEDKFTID